MDAPYGMCRLTHKSSKENRRGRTCVHTLTHSLSHSLGNELSHLVADDGRVTGEPHHQHILRA